MVAQRPLAERMKELQERIEALRQTKAQLEAREAAAERKRQERRRYLLGNFLLERLGQDSAWRELVRHELPLFLKEERDRKLFTELLAGNDGSGGAGGEESPGVTEPETDAGVLDMSSPGSERQEGG